MLRNNKLLKALWIWLVNGAFYQREADLESKEILGIHIEPMIGSKLRLLIAQREVSTGQRIRYESLGAQVDLSKNTLARLAEGKRIVLIF